MVAQHFHLLRIGAGGSTLQILEKLSLSLPIRYIFTPNFAEEPNFLSRLPISYIMSRLKKNIIYNLLGQALLLLLGFVSVKYIFGRLGEDALGIIYFTSMLNSISVSMLQMGICSVTVREISSNYEDNPKYCHDLIRTASFFFWAFFADKNLQ